MENNNSQKAFKEWAKRERYNPDSRANKNAPAGIYQGRSSHFFKAGTEYGERKGKYWN